MPSIIDKFPDLKLKRLLKENPHLERFEKLGHVHVLTRQLAYGLLEEAALEQTAEDGDVELMLDLALQVMRCAYRNEANEVETSRAAAPIQKIILFPKK